MACVNTDLECCGEIVMVSLQVKRPEKLKEQIYKTVKSLLTSGKLDQDTFYSANHFAEQLGVSRTPVREALLQLETEGYRSPKTTAASRSKSSARRKLVTSLKCAS
jgi:DNA-binding FadR family transcriptional regulator